MKTCMIFHSHSGVTRGIAEQIEQEFQGDLIEVRPRHAYSSLTLVPGCYRALRGLPDPVIPQDIDVSAYDLIILGTPVWAGRSTPVINGAIDTLTGCQGKKVFLYITCRDAKSGNQAAAGMRARIEGKGMVCVGMHVLDAPGVSDAGEIQRLLGEIRSAGDVQ